MQIAENRQLQLIGYDFTHQANDELWQSPEVQALLHDKDKPPPKSDEQKKLEKKARNDKFYQKRRKEYRDVVNEWKPKLDAKVISQ